MAVKMTHLTPRDAEDSYKTVLDYKGDNGSQIPGQNTAGDEERKAVFEDIKILSSSDTRPITQSEKGKISEGFPQRKD